MVKRDGGFNYDSTDMAAINYRFNTLKADRCVYITDKGQEFHFKQIFEAAFHSKLIDKEKHQVDHMGFGLVLGEDGGKIKSRSGDTVKLKELLDEARDRALEISKQKTDDQEELKFTEEQMLENAEIVGMCSVKYFDLKQNRVSNYKFEYDKILDPRGDSGCYLLYMYARIQSIFAKGNYTPEKIRTIAEKTSIKITTA